MSAMPPTVEGTQSPSQIEFFWERYKTLVWTIVLAVVAALGINYAVKYYSQSKADAKWSALSDTIGLRDAYTTELDQIQLQFGLEPSLADSLKAKDLASLESALTTGTADEKPFILVAIARKAMMDGNWSRSDAALSQLEKDYPQHSLNQVSKLPVQARELVKGAKKPEPGKEPEMKPAKEGSIVGLMRQQLEAARGYQRPARFQAAEVPADTKKVKFEMSGGFGSFTIALRADKAPKQVEEFLKLAAQDGGFWKGLAVNQIMRPTKKFNMGQSSMEMLLGFDSTRNEDDKTKWNDKEPSKHLVDFEDNDLSHFPGAVSARPQDGGKSGAEQFWINATDASQHDGERVIFGQVVEGLDNVKRICEAAMSVQDEERGDGKPSTNIRVESVTILP